MEHMRKNRTIISYEFIDGECGFMSEALCQISLADTYIISANIVVDESPNYDVDDIIE